MVNRQNETRSATPRWPWKSFPRAADPALGDGSADFRSPVNSRSVGTTTGVSCSCPAGMAGGAGFSLPPDFTQGQDGSPLQQQDEGLQPFSAGNGDAVPNPSSDTWSKAPSTTAVNWRNIIDGKSRSEIIYFKGISGEQITPSMPRSIRRSGGTSHSARRGAFRRAASRGGRGALKSHPGRILRFPNGCGEHRRSARG